MSVFPSGFGISSEVIETWDLGSRKPRRSVSPPLFGSSIVLFLAITPNQSKLGFDLFEGPDHSDKILFGVRNCGRAGLTRSRSVKRYGAVGSRVITGVSQIIGSLLTPLITSSMMI